MKAKDLIDLYQNEFRELNSSREESYRTFDKVLVAFSSGGLGYTFLLVKDAQNLKCCPHAILITFAALCFLVSIFSSVYSLMKTSRAYEKLIDLINKRFTKLACVIRENCTEEEKNIDEFEWWSEEFQDEYEVVSGHDTRVIQTLNNLTFVSALGGTVFIALLVVSLKS